MIELKLGAKEPQFHEVSEYNVRNKISFLKISFSCLKGREMATESRNQESLHSGRLWASKMAKKFEKNCFSSICGVFWVELVLLKSFQFFGVTP